MKLLLALSVLTCLPYLGHSTASQCYNVNNFSAATFDPVNFVPSKSYHDETNGLTLYVNVVDKGAQLFDFNTGTVYVKRADGSCVKFQTDNLKIVNRDTSLPPISVRQTLSYTIKPRDTRLGLQMSVGDLVYKILVDDACYASFVSFSFNNKLKLAYFNSDLKALTSAEGQKVQTALQDFGKLACQTQAI
ncbi:hypothetical protein RRG08_033158 [Elysia crispata]|uniref:Uncharacterized protein n=1 Tax=Elysia crispata TaxID=231223 RepID=A0AAE0YXG1_9GAST|nr:hypothetical protein RRG08_033158 [Elysia crispata]